MMRLLTRPTDSPTYGWVVITTFMVNYSLVDIAALTIGLLLPSVSREMGLSGTQQGLLSSAVVVGNLVFEIPANAWLSRYRPWRIASIAFIASALLTLLNGWSPNFVIFLVMRLLLGFAYVVCKVPRTLVLLQWVSRRRIPLANGIIFSVIDSMSGIGFMVIPVVLGLLDDWRLTLYAWGAMIFGAAVVWLVVGKDRYTPEYRAGIQSQVGTPLRALFKYREPWIMGFGTGGAIAARIGFMTFWPSFTLDAFDITLTFSGIVIGMVSIASTPGKLAVSIIPSLVKHPSMVLFASGLLTFGSFVGMLYTDSAVLLLLLGFVNGIGFCYFPLMVTQIYELPEIRPRELTVTVSVMFTLLWVGGFFGPLIVGVIDDATQDLQFALLVISFCSFSLSVAALLLSAFRTRAPIGQHPSSSQQQGIS